MTAHNTDANHTAVIRGLRSCGYRVEDLSVMGGGVPDLLVGTPWRTLCLLEVKNPEKPPSERRLTPQQLTWHALWRHFQVYVVLSAGDAVAQMSAGRKVA